MENITLQQMLFFLGVAESKSFSSASKDLLYSQPAISRGIQRLEDAVGVKLFTRTQNGVELTDQGNYLYSEWKPLISRLSHSVDFVKTISRSDNNELRIQSCDSGTIIKTITEAKRRFRQLYPDTDVKYDIYEHREMCKRILAGNITLSFTYTLPMPDMPVDTKAETFAYWGIEQTEAKILSSLGTYVFTSKNNPCAGDSCRLEDLKEQQLLLHSNMDLEDAAFCRMALLPPVSEPFGPIAECKRAGFYPKVLFLPNLFSILNAVTTNEDYYFILGDIFGDQQLADIVKYPIADTVEEHYSIAVWRRGMLSDMERAFLDIVQELS